MNFMHLFLALLSKYSYNIKFSDAFFYLPLSPTSGEIGRYISEPDINTETRNSLVSLSKEIVSYDMAHNTESEACDLLMEIECLGEQSFNLQLWTLRFKLYLFRTLLISR